MIKAYAIEERKGLNMEVEMKYGISSKEAAERIWADEDLAKLGKIDSKETVFMKAAYFDTEDYILSKNDIAFRIRMEGSRVVASLKWAGDSVGGLHTREEINVPVADEACFINPKPCIFQESEQGKGMIELVGDRPLHSILETRFLRSRLRLDTGKSICEMAIDVGEIVTDFGTAPICELEIELFSGEQSEIERIGSLMMERYQIQPEDQSKYARGLHLLEANKYREK